MSHYKNLMMVALLTSTVVNAQETNNTSDCLARERVFSEPALSRPRGCGVKLSPDGSLITSLKAKPDNQQMTDLWAADVKGGAPRLLVDGLALIPDGRAVSETEKSRRERQ